MQGATSVMWLTVSVAFSVPVLAQSANEIDRYLPVPDLGALSARPGSELASVVDRYSSRKSNDTTIDEIMETLDFRLTAALDFTEDEKSELVAFLESLTDPSARDLSSLTPARVPSGLPVR